MVSDDDGDDDDDDEEEEEEECVSALPTSHVRNNEMHFRTSVSGALHQRLGSAHHVSTAHRPFGHGVSARRFVALAAKYLVNAASASESRAYYF